MKQRDRQKWSKYKPCPQQQSGRLRTACRSLRGCSDEDTGAPAPQKGSSGCFSHQEKRAECQRSRYPPRPSCSLAGPELPLALAPSSILLASRAEEHLCCLSSQMAPAQGCPCCLEGCWGSPAGPAIQASPFTLPLSQP